MLKSTIIAFIIEAIKMGIDEIRHSRAEQKRLETARKVRKNAKNVSPIKALDEWMKEERAKRAKAWTPRARRVEVDENPYKETEDR